MSERPLLEITGLSKSFGDNAVLRDIALTVEHGERIAIIGGSGSGKSTLLRCLNFMDMPTSGVMKLDGAQVGRIADGRVTYAERDLIAVRKRIGMVFQQFNLFPHMTALENVMEALITVKGLKKREAERIAQAELARVGLTEKAGAYPARLSGGQQQRVAIARALAMQPEVLLFDEPTSSLDPELVGEVLATILALAAEGRTMLLVTHELGFAYHFATRVIFLADGAFHEMGTPEDLLKNPKRERTRTFIQRFTEFSF